MRVPAEVWFSTYKEADSPKLAAIIVDLTDDQNPISTATDSEQIDDERTVLNDRESEVLRLVVQGPANKEIAAQMSISESAVKNTLQQLFGKTGVRTRSHLVRIALERYRDIL